MARVSQSTLHKSSHYPARLSYEIEQDMTFPELKKSQEVALIALGSFGWRLLRARARKKTAEKLAQKWRDIILERFPDGVYGIRVYNHKPIRIVVSRIHHEEPADAASFIKFLGPHAADIITGLRLPLDKLLSNPSDYRRFIGAICQEFGAAISEEVGVTLNKAAFWGLVEAGELPSPPDDLFRESEDSERRVTVTSIAHRDQG